LEGPYKNPMNRGKKDSYMNIYNHGIKAGGKQKKKYKGKNITGFRATLSDGVCSSFTRENKRYRASE